MTFSTGKNIIVCSDGTGNTAIKGRGTNVFKIFESVDLNGHRFNANLSPQVATYDDGVGTQSWKIAKIFSGAFGYGLSRNVRQLYRELCRIYDPGDRIFLFGFSRGAFTVRTLAGLIAKCGIIDVSRLGDSDAFEAIVSRAYEVYRECYRTDLAKFFFGEPDAALTEEFKTKYCHPTARIRFMGVWDTVDAVGLPLPIADFVNKSIYPFKFPNLELSDRVDIACHALSVDDDRQAFHPLLWDEKHQHNKPNQVLEQVWFAGAHSNVGGGYPKQGMSLVALDWMMSRAEQAGLRFIKKDRDFYQQHASVDDKLYSPRSGLGVFYRWAPRDIAQFCKQSSLQPKLHLSVLERIAHGTDDYCPGNLPPYASIVTTDTGDANKNATAAERANEAQTVLRHAHQDNLPLLSHVQKEVRLGRYSYQVFMTTCLATLCFAAATQIEPAYSLQYLWAVAKALVTAPLPLITIAAGFSVALLLATYTNKHLLRTYSQFWFHRQKALRAALKRARKTMHTAVSQSKAA